MDIYDPDLEPPSLRKEPKKEELPEKQEPAEKSAVETKEEKLEDKVEEITQQTKEQERKGKEPSYKELVAQVAVLSRMLNCYVEHRDTFDKSGGLARTLLENTPEKAEEMIRKNRHMAYALRQVKQSFHTLISAQVLPSEGWDAALQQIIDSINDAIEATEDEVQKELAER